MVIYPVSSGELLRDFESNGDKYCYEFVNWCYFYDICYSAKIPFVYLFYNESFITILRMRRNGFRL